MPNRHTFRKSNSGIVMITKDVKIRVRYKDTDKMGVVYHSNYIVYYEVARTEMLRELDIPYSEMEAQGVMMPILEIESKYIAPAYYDEEITVRAIIDAEPMARINVRYEVFNEAGQTINTGHTVLGFVNSTTRRPCRAPQQFVEIIRKELEKSAE